MPAGPLLVREASCRAAIVNSSGRVTEQGMATSQAVNGDGRVRALDTSRAPTVRSANKTMELAGGSDTLNLITLSSSTSAAVRYRGDMEFTLEGGVLTAVNVLNIEDYLRGVNRRKYHPTGDPEALKAQAVAARNYALESAQTSRGIFDVRCDVSSQVYGGYDAESPATNNAVDETRGMVMLEGNRMVSAFFHSCSGGYTENSEDVWNNSLSYIQTKPDPYDYNDVYYNWHVNYTTEQLIKKLSSAGYEFTEIEDIKELAYTESGERVKKLQITGKGESEKPVTVVISNADNVRIALDLKSSLFRLTKKYDRDKNLAGVEIEGSGWATGWGCPSTAPGAWRRKVINTRIF
ncbi:MAG: SpoIID/LytB domain-containing protein [Candidatus Syntrophopropionicum ammoniitolerans]